MASIKSIFILVVFRYMIIATSFAFTHTESMAGGNNSFKAGDKPLVDTLCKEPAFDYPDFGNAEGLVFVGSAKKVGSRVRLTESAIWQVGAIWYGKIVPIKEGFKTEFSFQLKNGENNGYDDGSTPGADGLAFVIQNQGSNALGDAGSGIGFTGITNSIAIEFDTYANQKHDVGDMRDPNGNHVGMFSMGKLANQNNHTSIAHSVSNDRVIDMTPDGRILYVKIEYKMSQKQLRVYLDTLLPLTEPCLSLEPIDLAELLDLDKGEGAYLGITASTGNSFEVHDILSWRACVSPSQGIEEVYGNDNQVPDVAVNPNPAGDKACFRLKVALPSEVVLELYDMFGNRIVSLNEGWVDAGWHEIISRTSSIPAGMYWYSLRIGSERKFGKFIITK